MAAELDAKIVISLTDEVTSHLKEMTNGFANLKEAGAKASSAFDWSMKLNQASEGARHLADRIGAVTAEPLHLAEATEVSFGALRRSSHTTGAAFEDLKAKVAGLSAGTRFDVTELAGAMTTLTKRGTDVNTALTEMKPITELAEAGQMELKDAVDLTSQILKRYGAAAGEAGRYTDLIVRAASVGGVPVADKGHALETSALSARALGMQAGTAAGLIAAFAQSGLSAGAAASTLDQVLSHATSPRGISQFQKGVGLLARLGIDIKGNMSDIPALLAEVAAKTEKSGQSAAGLATTYRMLFGSTQLASIMKTIGPAGLQGYVDKAKDADDATKKLAEDVGGTAVAAHARNEASTKRLQAAIGTGLVPVAKWWDNLSASIKDHVANMAQTHDVATAAVGLTGGALGKLAGGAATAMNVVGTLAGTAGMLNLTTASGKTTGQILTGLIPALNLAKIAAFGLQAAAVAAVGAVGFAIGSAIDEFAIKPLWENKGNQSNDKEKAEMDQQAQKMADNRRQIREMPATALEPLTGAKHEHKLHVVIDDQRTTVKSTQAAPGSGLSFGDVLANGYAMAPGH